MTATPSTAAMLESETTKLIDDLIALAISDGEHLGWRSFQGWTPQQVLETRAMCQAVRTEQIGAAIAAALDAKERLIAERDAEIARLREAAKAGLRAVGASDAYIAELRSALEPFVRELSAWNEAKIDRHVVEMHVTLGQLRKARTALQTTEQTEMTNDRA